MAGDFHQLIDAAIGHLNALRARGAQFVPLSPDTWQSLHGPVNRAKIENRALASTQEVQANQAPIASETFAGSSRADTPVGNGSAKATALAELRERALQCMKCAHLSSTRRNVVFGVGNIDAELMFVGEAPGADEDLQGEPFVGAAGQLLTRMIQTMGLSRGQVYIANILKCRPDMLKGSAGNRKPTPAEMQTCIPYLHAQIDLIQPKVLVALGGTALEGLLGKSGISKWRGQWHSYRGIPLMPTFHPAFLLHQQGSVADKRKVWEDLMAVMEKLGLPISDKQRGYFLR